MKRRPAPECAQARSRAQADPAATAADDIQVAPDTLRANHPLDADAGWADADARTDLATMPIELARQLGLAPPAEPTGWTDPRMAPPRVVGPFPDDVPTLPRPAPRSPGARTPPPAARFAVRNAARTPAPKPPPEPRRRLLAPHLRKTAGIAAVVCASALVLGAVLWWGGTHGFSVETPRVEVASAPLVEPLPTLPAPPEAPAAPLAQVEPVPAPSEEPPIPRRERRTRGGEGKSPAQATARPARLVGPPAPASVPANERRPAPAAPPVAKPPSPTSGSALALAAPTASGALEGPGDAEGSFADAQGDESTMRLRILHYREFRAAKRRPEAKVLSSEEADPADFVWPVPSNYITSRFGKRKDPLDPEAQKVHRGVDIRCAKGTPVLAAADGEVIRVKGSRRAGTTIRVVHADGIHTLYAHLSKAHVKQGDRVRAGQQVGLSGQSGRVTGPHLHFEVWKDRKPTNPQRYVWRQLSPPDSKPEDGPAVAERPTLAGGTQTAAAAGPTP